MLFSLLIFYYCFPPVRSFKLWLCNTHVFILNHCVCFHIFFFLVASKEQRKVHRLRNNKLSAYPVSVSWLSVIYPPSRHRLTEHRKQSERKKKKIKEQLSELPGWTSDTCCSSSAGKLWICWEEKMSSEGKTTGWVFLTLLVFLILLARIALFSLLISNRYLPPTFFLLLIFKTKNTTEFMTGTGLRPGRTACSPYLLTALYVAWRWAVCHPFPRRLQRNADSGLSPKTDLRAARSLQQRFVHQTKNTQ